MEALAWAVRSSAEMPNCDSTAEATFATVKPSGMVRVAAVELGPRLSSWMMLSRESPVTRE